MSKTEPPALLWHYTDFEALRGIITKGELFASSLAYVNDSEEFLFTIKPLLEHLESAGVSLSDLSRGLFPDNVASKVMSVFRKFRGQAHYVTCFSKERDDLSQWRSYSPRPPGFAIGFQRDKLESLANSFDFKMLECRYPQPDELLVEIISTFKTATRGIEEDKRLLLMPASKEALENFTNRWAISVILAIIRLAPKNKHPKFSAEKEVRLVGSNTEKRRSHAFQVEYRLSGSLVVPYIKIPARPKKGPSPIKVILVGPCPHQEAVIATTRQMCAQHNVKAEVLPSDIPYRNW